MKWRLWIAGLLLPVLTLPLILIVDEAPAGQGGAKKGGKITWKKIVIDKAFRSEGVAVADVNKDGKMDILVGDVWYEAPTWKVHKIRPGKDDYRDGNKNVYSNTFCCWADDINGDGWPDLIVIGYPGAPCHWYENPKGKPGPWKEHVIHHSACNETPQYEDLFHKGKRVLIMGTQPKGSNGKQGQMCWFAPSKDPTQLWEVHPISEPSAPGKEIPGTQRYSHGLGVGDVNGDGRPDVIIKSGWWEQPAQDDGKPWKFHPANLGDDCADMFAYDMDGDGMPDILSSSAHRYGIWWHKQTRVKGGESKFVTRDLFKKLLSQTHALHFVDINGDGLRDLVTGRRWWAHGPKGDPGSEEPAVLYWFQAKKNKDGSTEFIPHLIDDESGVGTQFVVTDFDGDGLPDIIVSNKRGVFLFLQVRSKD
jgi:hypothetical protein